MRNRRRVGLLVVVALVFVCSTSSALAVPAFARKYRTSCQTCHIVYPKLTPFGEAFRLNGYRFPEGRDEEFRKEDPVKLGAEGYKKVFPKAVWPADIPGTAPVAVVFAAEAAYTRNQDPRTQIPEVEAELLAAGTVGENVAFYGEVEFELEFEGEETETAIERLFVAFTPRRGPHFNFKAGLFEPGIALVSNHRRITGPRYWFTRPPTGVAGSGEVIFDNAFRLESPAQAGIEFWGVPSHRILWNAGIVEGRFNEPNNSKDIYARIAGKWGGMRLDGTVKEGEDFTIEKPQPWRERSVAASAFYYDGTASLEVAPAVLQEDDFTIMGADVQVNVRDVIIHAGYAMGENDNPDITGIITNVDSESIFIEVDWVAYPWLVPALRWETFELSNAFGDDRKERWAPTINFLVRANVLAFLSAEIEKEMGSSLKAEEIEAGIAIAF